MTPLSNPTYLVIGLQASGTTWGLRLLEHLGFSTFPTAFADRLGVTTVPDTRKGSEYEPLRTQCKHALVSFSDTSRWPHEVRLDACRDRSEDLAHLTYPEAVKVPSVGPAHLLPLIKPTYVIWVYRPTSSRTTTPPDRIGWEGQDITRVTWGVTSLLDALEETATPYTILPYPRAAHDPYLAHTRLSPILDTPFDTFHAAHARATNPDWIR